MVSNCFCRLIIISSEKNLKKNAFIYFLIIYLGNLNGRLFQLPASDLGAIVIKEVLKRAEINGADVDEVIIGQVKYVQIALKHLRF